jgi:hypothetical protein
MCYRKQGGDDEEMKTPTLLSRLLALLWLFLAACDADVRTDNAAPDTVHVRDTVYVAQNTTADSTSFLDPMEVPVTLPVLDGFFQDSAFAGELRDSLQLSDEQITELRRAAREEGGRLGSDTAAVDSTMTPGTMGARTRAMQRISGIIGPEKTYHLGRLVRTRWAGSAPEGVAMGTNPNSVPADTRVVINAPSFRMDLFENGQLVKSYPISAGYPEFPLPVGMRSASEIIFNPSWTPPDEPWVESSNKVKVGERVDPGSKLNPLGIMKIPIGGPSLIHGGKSQGQLGTFGSHGCAGLTNEQAREFARLLAEVSGAQLTDKQIAEYGRNKSESQTLKLGRSIPVELRYETMVVQDGALHFYPDVYDRGMNTEENLRAVLQASGVALEQLTEQERTKVMNALAQMGGTTGGAARGDTAAASSRADTTTKKGTAASPQQVKVTKSVKGPKELIVPIAALKGKGYPKPVKAATRKPGVTKKSDTTV